MSEPQAGWYSDPKGSYLYRFWNGTQWTDQVSNGGTHSGIDPDPVSANMVATLPAPGTAAPSATPLRRRRLKSHSHAARHSERSLR